MAGAAKGPRMNLWALLVAALLLSLERLCYVWVWRTPGAFRAWCDRPAMAVLGEPVEVLQKLFYGFKVLQGAVFFGWCYWQGNGTPGAFGGDVAALGVGIALLVVGQLLNVSVFYRLGKVGVFYGNRLGYELPCARAFPFSCSDIPSTLARCWPSGACSSPCAFRTTIGMCCPSSKPCITL